MVKDFRVMSIKKVELYIPGVCLNEVEQKLKENDAIYTSTFDRNNDGKDKIPNFEVKIVNSIAFLLTRHHLKNMRQCILEDFDSSITEKILSKENELRNKTPTDSTNTKNDDTKATDDKTPDIKPMDVEHDTNDDDDAISRL